MLKKIYLALVACVALLATGSCTGDLNQTPVIGENATTVYASLQGYESVLAKIYGSYSLVGQQKADNKDLSSYNGQDLLRNYFNLQEAPTDETAMRWLSGDNLSALTFMTWDATDSWVSDTYYRLYYTIALCNEFLRYCTDDALAGFDENTRATIKTYAYEARFMRALTYYLVLDLFRQGPFVDENTPSSGFTPEAYDGTKLFTFIESEIKDIETGLLDVAPYGRACKAAAWALAAKMYLNAEVYTGTSHATDCITYCNKILDCGRYSLEPEYRKLFNADNDKRTNEIIFAFASDAKEATTWGSGTYIVCGSCGSDSSQNPADYGLASGWGSWRVRGEFYDLFTDGAADHRCLFWTDGQSQYLDTAIDDGTQGYYSEKWTNLTDDGLAASDSGADGCNTDFPMFRLADVYLMAAEAVLRGGAGMARDRAIELMNMLRERAYGNYTGYVADSQFTLDFIIAERGRELYHECTRRTDLVRFGLFTTANYLWQWKGGVVDGRAVSDRYNIYPIPATELSANPNLTNPLY